MSKYTFEIRNVYNALVCNAEKRLVEQKESNISILTRAHKEINDRLASAKANIENSRLKARRAVAEYHPKKEGAGRIRDQKLALALTLLDVEKERAEFKKASRSCQITALNGAFLTAPEADEALELQLDIEREYNDTLAEAQKAYDEALGAATAEYYAADAEDAKHDAEVMAIDAKFNAELQIVIHEAAQSHATIDAEGKRCLEQIENEYHEARRKRLAIWRTPGLTAAEMLERLVALSRNTPR